MVQDHDNILLLLLLHTTLLQRQQRNVYKTFSEHNRITYDALYHRKLYMPYINVQPKPL